MKTIEKYKQTKIAFTIRVPEHVLRMLDEFARDNYWSRNVAATVILENQLHKNSKEQTDEKAAALN